MEPQLGQQEVRGLTVHRLLIRSNPRLAQPFISVILPTIGRAKVHQATQSLINSSYPAFEILIIHDRERRGSTIARNVGLMLARADFVHFAEEDCIYEAGTLRALMQRYRDSKQTVYAGRRARKIPVISHIAPSARSITTIT